MQSSISRRRLVGWAVATLATPTALAKALMTTADSFAVAPVTVRCSALFGSHLADQSRQLWAAAIPGVHAAIFEDGSEPEDKFRSRTRWLCVSREGEDGTQRIQVSSNAMCEYSSSHPVELQASLNDDGTLEVFEELTRGHITNRWREMDDSWQLISSSSVHVFHDEIIQEDYSRDRAEVVVSRGKISEDDPLTAIAYPAPGSFAMADFSGIARGEA